MTDAAADDPPRTFTDETGTYERVSAAEFESYDDVDSSTVDDPGAPQDERDGSPDELDGGE